MSEAASHLKLLDTSTGEVHDHCPGCVEKDEKLAITHRKLDAAWAEIAKLKRDHALEQRRDPQHGLVEVLHREWQEACRHPGSDLDYGKDTRCEAWLRALKLAKRMRKRLGLGKDVEPAALVRVALAGAAFDPYTTQRRNGNVERYDDPTTIFKNLASFERFVNRAPREARERLLRPKGDGDG